MNTGRLSVFCGAGSFAALLLAASPASATLMGDFLGTAGNFAVLGSGSSAVTASGVVNGDFGAVTTLVNQGTINGNARVAGSVGTLVNQGPINGNAAAFQIVNVSPGTITTITGGAAGAAIGAAAQTAENDLATGKGTFASATFLPATTHLLSFPTALTPGKYWIDPGTLSTDIVLALNSGGAGGLFELAVSSTGGGSFTIGNGVDITIIADSPLDQFLFQSASLSAAGINSIKLGGTYNIDNFVFNLASFGAISGTFYGNYLLSSAVSVEENVAVCGRVLSQGSATIRGLVNAPTASVISDQCTFATTSVPEPGMLGIFGLAALGLVRWRRKAV